jgi:hypothetical protein
LSRSLVNDLEEALGQYVLYQDVMAYSEIDRTLYLAIRDEVYIDLFSEAIGQLLLEKKRFNLIVFDVKKEQILRWID